MKKRFIAGGGVLLIILAALYFLAFRKGDAAYEFRFDTVSEGDVTMSVTATGTINAVTTVEVGTQVSGIISKLYADFNSIVKEGQVIAQIDPTFLQQAVKDAEANLERVRAQYADAKRVAERTASLFEKGLESQASYDASQTAFESSSASLKQAQASLDRAKINLSYATIYAPINGVIIDRKVNVGQTVAASFSSPTLYTIANDLSKMQVQATVDESDIGRISIGQEATFTVDAYPDERFRGTVSQIRLAPVTIQNVVNYTVVIDVVNDQLKLMPGMTATVRILVGSSRNVLRISNLALRFQPPGELVDSAKVKELMASSPDGGSGKNRSWSRDGGSEQRGGDDRRARMKAIRDSVMEAHGGKLSEEELRAEMRKVFQARETRPTPKPTPPATALRRGQDTRFGIQVNFPEYQKNTASAVQRPLEGRVWILNNKGKVEPVTLTTGLSDGRYTEILTSSLKAGDQVVLGATSTSGNGEPQTTNPLSGQGQRGPRGGGFR